MLNEQISEGVVKRSKEHIHSLIQKELLKTVPDYTKIAIGALFIEVIEDYEDYEGTITIDSEKLTTDAIDKVIEEALNEEQEPFIDGPFYTQNDQDEYFAAMRQYLYWKLAYLIEVEND